MKLVTHIIIGLERGGAEMVLVRFVEAQRFSAEYRHAVISLTDLGCYGAHLEQLGIPVYVMGLKGPLGLPRVMFELVRRLRSLKPDLVQTWMYHADLLGGLAAMLVGSPPVIWGVHSFDLKRGAKLSTRIVQKLCAWASGYLPTLILCVAEASRRAHASVGYEAGRMRVVPNGFDVTQRPPQAEDVHGLREKHGIEPVHFVVGCVGRFHPAKDHHNFVRAAALVAPAFPMARFMMVGPGLDWSNAQLCEWIDAEEGLRERFALLGERGDVPVCLAAMDIFCSSSRTEAFPLVVGEAMLAGRPAVVTDVGDTALIVSDTAVVVECENAAALAAGLSSLLSAGPEYRQQLGLRAQQRVRAEYSIERSISETLQAYADALRLKEQSKKA